MKTMPMKTAPMINRSASCLSVIIVMLSLAVSAHAAPPSTYIWTTSNSGNWSTNANWQSHQGPSASSSGTNTTLTFDIADGNTVTATDNLGGNNSNFQLNSLIFTPGNPGGQATSLTIAAANNRSLEFAGINPSIITTAVGNGQQTLTISAPVTLDSTVSVTNPGSLNQGSLRGGLTFSGGVSGAGGLTLSQGVLTIGAATNYKGTTEVGSTGTAYLTEAATGVLSNNSNFTIDSQGTLFIYDDQTIAGLNGSGAIAVDPNQGEGTAASVTVGSGDASGNYNGTISGNLKFIKAGNGTQVLSGSNSYTGATDIRNGTLQVDSASGTGSGNVNVRANGTLSGTGTITPTGNNNIAVDGILSPGDANALGTLTIDAGSSSANHILVFNSGATLDFALGSGESSDELALLNGSPGDILFNNNVINFTDFNGETLGNGDYTLFDVSNSNEFKGLTVASNGDITAGLTIGSLPAQLDPTLMLINGQIQLQVVPEPSTWALMGTGLLLLVAWRIRSLRRQTAKSLADGDSHPKFEV